MVANSVLSQALPVNRRRFYAVLTLRRHPFAARRSAGGYRGRAEGKEKSAKARVLVAAIWAAGFVAPALGIALAVDDMEASRARTAAPAKFIWGAILISFGGLRNWNHTGGNAMPTLEEQGVRAIGIAWMREEDYPALIRIFEDGHMFDSWEQWSERAEATEKKFQSDGVIVLRA
jgi:hypothetical protein